jgi:hypothetical protein
VGWSNDQFIGELTIPTGATTGARITINHNGDGAIKVYNSANVLIAEISATADVIKALDASGVYARLRPDAPSFIADTPGPGLELGGMPGDTAPGALTEYDDTFIRGLFLRAPSPVADDSAALGIDFGAISVSGRFHGNDPQIQLSAGDPADAPDGFISLNGAILDANSQFVSYADATAYTPVLGNGGTATYSTRAGWYYRIGPMVFMNASFVITNAGSGAGTLTLTAPTNIDRTTRQYVGCHAENMGGNSGSLQAVAFTGGSGTTFDRVRNSTGANLTGASLAAGGILAFEGWYREEI